MVEQTKKLTVPGFVKKHQLGEKMSMVTAYDYTMAMLVERAGVDCILVGDSLGMVVQGHESTLPVTIDEMVYHTRCVARAVNKAMIIADMPFMSYQASHEDAVKNAGRLLQAGAQAVKLEGGEEIADLVWYLNKVGIPVMGHIGLKPQSINTMGGYKVQGKSKKQAQAILEDAEMLTDADVFSLLLEGIPIEVTQKIKETVEVPTIGIGSGPDCSGQVLVLYDILGANPDFKPKFVKNYARLDQVVVKALKKYHQEVQKGVFPEESHSTHQSLVEVKSLQKKKG